MTKTCNYIVRRLMPVVSAGFLFQTSGCAVDTNAIFSSLATTIANQLITSIVFGAFGIAP